MLPTRAGTSSSCTSTARDRPTPRTWAASRASRSTPTRTPRGMAGLGSHKTVETSAGQMTYIQAIQSALRDEMERDPAVIVLGEDVGAKGGVFKATEGLQKLYGESRVIDTPLAESTNVG